MKWRRVVKWDRIRRFSLGLGFLGWDTLLRGLAGDRAER